MRNSFAILSALGAGVLVFSSLALAQNTVQVSPGDGGFEIWVPIKD